MGSETITRMNPTLDSNVGPVNLSNKHVIQMHSLYDIHNTVIRTEMDMVTIQRRKILKAMMYGNEIFARVFRVSLGKTNLVARIRMAMVGRTPLMHAHMIQMHTSSAKSVKSQQQMLVNLKLKMRIHRSFCISWGGQSHYSFLSSLLHW
jgi:hypothetical protein